MNTKTKLNNWFGKWKKSKFFVLLLLKCVSFMNNGDTVMHTTHGKYKSRNLLIWFTTAAISLSLSRSLYFDHEILEFPKSFSSENIKCAINGAYSLRVKRWLSVHLSITCNNNKRMHMNSILIGRKADTIKHKRAHTHPMNTNNETKLSETNNCCEHWKATCCYRLQTFAHCSISLSNLLVSSVCVRARSSMWVYQFFL